MASVILVMQGRRAHRDLCTNTGSCQHLRIYLFCVQLAETFASGGAQHSASATSMRKHPLKTVGVGSLRTAFRMELVLSGHTSREGYKPEFLEFSAEGNKEMTCGREATQSRQRRNPHRLRRQDSQRATRPISQRCQVPLLLCMIQLSQGATSSPLHCPPPSES